MEIIGLKKPPRQTMSVLELAVRLGIGRNQAYQMVGRGEVPHIRSGRRILIPIDLFEKSLAGEDISAAAASREKLDARA
jgi:excisionase family DNA binding protein